MKTKAYTFLIFLFSVSSFYSQIAIGKPAVDGSSILDFAENTNKGIILPAIGLLPASMPNGALVFSRQDKAIYMYENDKWVALSDGKGVAPIVINPNEEMGKGVIIGADKSNDPGVLVLESATLALTLPKVDKPHLNVKGPYPGMICYDTASNTIAVFDGAYWSFWK